MIDIVSVSFLVSRKLPPLLPLPPELAGGANHTVPTVKEEKKLSKSPSPKPAQSPLHRYFWQVFTTSFSSLISLLLCAYLLPGHLLRLKKTVVLPQGPRDVSQGTVMRISR